MLTLLVLSCQQVDLVVGLERDVALGVQVAADDVDIAVLAATTRADGDVITGREHAAAVQQITGSLPVLRFRMADRQAHLRRPCSPSRVSMRVACFPSRALA